MTVYQYCIRDDKCMYVTKWLCISIVCTYSVQIEHGRTIIGIIAIFIQCQMSLYFNICSMTRLKSRQFTWNHWSHGSHYTSVSHVTDFSLVIYCVASQVTYIKYARCCTLLFISHCIKSNIYQVCLDVVHRYL